MMYGRLYAIAVMVVLSAAIAVGCKKDGDGDGNDGRISFPVESYIVDYTSTLVVVDYESDFDVEVTGLPSWCQLERMEPGAAVIAVGRNDGQRRLRCIQCRRRQVGVRDSATRQGHIREWHDKGRQSGVGRP